MREKYWPNGMMGLVVGDALGLPVQFEEREYMATREQGPVTGMEGFGAFLYPEGTWSDDSSMALATLCSINKNGAIDTEDIMSRFLDWYRGSYTPFGTSFDQGNTCIEAILNYGRGADAKHCGKTGEYANGNGALMRILPACLWCYEQEKAGLLTVEDVVEKIHSVASLTHNHLRSNMACGLYYFMCRAVLDFGKEFCLQDCVQKGIDQGLAFYGKDISNLTQMAYYGRLFHLEEFKEVSDDEISFSGYVVDTIEAAVWSLINTSSYKECLLKIVNYGDDSDTVGAVAGGLAGLYYGYESIPTEWTQEIQRKKWVMDVIEGNIFYDDGDIDKEEVEIEGIADIHTHIAYGIDDGAIDLEMSMEMLQSEYDQGVRHIFLTPHSDCVLDMEENYTDVIQGLKERCKTELPLLKLHEGCEIYVDSENIENVIGFLKYKRLPTMNHSSFVLVEFENSPEGMEEGTNCIRRLSEEGFIPIIAHVERYAKFIPEIEMVEQWKDLGALVQINFYSICEEKNESIRKRANELLNRDLVDFLGSDSHQTGHRVPKIYEGVKHLKENYPAEYVDQILRKNVQRLL